MNVGDNINAENANWKFQGEVCKSFDKHIGRSVPMYQEGHDIIAQLSDFFLSDNSLCYDLGCSTGELLKKISERNSGKNVSYIGVDLEKDMIKEANLKCKNIKEITIKESNILDIEFEKTDLIIAHYTMQFIRPKNRQIIFDRIYNALNWGGAFILFEKVRSNDARFQDIFTALYTDFKLKNGYSSDEILGKTQSLKGILEPFSTQGNMDLLKRAGFIDMTSIMKYVCFEGFLAIK